MKTLRVLGFTFVLLAAACSDKDKKVGLDERGPVLPVDHPAIEIPLAKQKASVQRVSVSQLRNTVATVMGNDASGNPIRWMAGATPGLDVYDQTLGEADFLNITEDNLEASSLYAKFMDDMARDACNRVLTSDYARPVQGERAVVRMAALSDTNASSSANIESNLNYLKLRFHGVKVTSSDQVAALKTLFETTVMATAGTAPQRAREGWRAVCVALVRAPEFHFY